MNDLETAVRSHLMWRATMKRMCTREMAEWHLRNTGELSPVEKQLYPDLEALRARVEREVEAA